MQIALLFRRSRSFDFFAYRNTAVRALTTILFALLFALAAVAAEDCTEEQEPNDRPEDAQTFTNAFCVDGSISDSNQAIFSWTVDTEASKRPWLVELSGPEGQETRLQIHRLEEPGDANNPAVIGPELAALVTPAGSNTVQRANFFITPGTWMIGVSTSAGAGGAYHVSFNSTAALSDGVSADNSSAETALPVAAEFNLQSILEKSDSWFNWQLSGIDARKRWTLTATAPIGASVGLDLQTSDGKPILAATQIKEGRLELPDIGLPPGTYRVHLKSEEAQAYPFALFSASQGPRSPGREEEPNDNVLSARPLTLGQPMTGRISQPGDVDTYVLPAAAAGQLLNIQLGGESKAIKRLCMSGADGSLLQCREGVMPNLTDIVVTEANRYFIVTGGPSPDATYDLIARVAGQATADAESEPNDTGEQADRLAEPNMRGRFAGEDADFFRFTVSDNKLRKFQLTGEAAASMEVTDLNGVASARVERRADAAGKPTSDPLQLADLALAPGEYLLIVKGRDGDYVIASEAVQAAEKAGPPPEREPNDELDQAQALEQDGPITGTLSTDSDIDQYRISLRTPQAIAIHLDTNESCPVEFSLNWTSWSGKRAITTVRGKGFVYPARLEAGDYIIALQQKAPCATPGAYAVWYDAMPDLGDVGDIEPNDYFGSARPLSPELKVAGTVGQFEDEDWFRLPLVENDVTVTIIPTGDVEITLTDGKATSSFQLSQPTEIASGDKGERVQGTVPAGAAAAIRVKGRGNYTLAVVMGDGSGPSASKSDQAPGPQDISPRPSSEDGSLKLQLAFESTQAAAYWHRGQRIQGKLTLVNGASKPMEASLSATALQPGWQLKLPEKATVGANETATIPVTLEIPPDAFAARSVRVAVLVKSGALLLASTNVDFAVGIAAPPIGDHLMFALPDELLGGFNAAWNALGGTITEPDPGGDEDTLVNINDGLGSNAGYIVDAAKLPRTITVHFGGDKTWPVRGMTINPQTPGVPPTEYIGNFELLLSADGTKFERVLTGVVSTEPREQPFVLPQAINAKAAQLRILSNHDGNLGNVALSEWKVIVDPKVSVGSGLDLADTLRGGHIVWSDPLISDETRIIKGVLEAGGKGPVVSTPAGVAPHFTVGFHEDRAARISELEWIDTEPELEASTFPSVIVEASTETPLGPWKALGEWKLDATTPSIKTFDSPVWARFLRFTSTQAAGEGGEKMQFPTKLRVTESANDDHYRSILGEWGQYATESSYEKNLPAPAAAKPESDDNDTREKAETLHLEQLVSGRVEIGRDVDWYKIAQPEGLDLLTIELGGEPTIGAEITLTDEAGKPVSLIENSGTPRKAELQARVDGNKTYYLQVVQPPHTVMIAYDTSASLLAFIPIIHNALEVFAAGVNAGQEAVNFMPFDSPAMLPDFTDQQAILKQALANDDRASTTSGLEGTSIAAMRALSNRRGTRALLVVTDAASSTTGAVTDMWRMIDQTRPRIFAAHIGSLDDPLREKQTMQDLSLANGGHYASSRSQSELDVAFERVAAWLRRPASYTLIAKAGKAAPPEPGQLVVASTLTPPTNGEVAAVVQEGGNALEIVLDASGSMLKRMDGRRRIEIARASLGKLVTAELKPDDPVALRVFGHDRPGSCETALALPLGPLDPTAMTEVVNGIVPQNLAKTPIAASLREVANDLQEATGNKTVILLTDGEETCGGDPRAEISALASRNIQVRVNIVGFAVDDPALKREFQEWARIGGGRYFDAANANDLDDAIKAATELPYTVYDSSGNVAAQGSVDGSAIAIPAGHYRVEIASTPPQIFTDVMIKEKEVTKLNASKI